MAGLDCRVHRVRGGHVGVREPVAVLVFAIVGLLPATVVASAWSSSSQLRQRLRSLIRLPGSTGWYGVALLVPPTVLALGAQLTALAGGQILSTPEPPPAGASVLGFTVVSFAYTLLYAGGLNEEIGWTGFALRRLLRSFSSLTASVLLWTLWITWHLPFHYSGHWNADPVSFRVALIASSSPGSCSRGCSCESRRAVDGDPVPYLGQCRVRTVPSNLGRDRVVRAAGRHRCHQGPHVEARSCRDSAWRDHPIRRLRRDDRPCHLVGANRPVHA
jgi:membrane protease YdiL (CAAX protease family)